MIGAKSLAGSIFTCMKVNARLIKCGYKLANRNSETLIMWRLSTSCLTAWETLGLLSLNTPKMIEAMLVIQQTITMIDEALIVLSIHTSRPVLWYMYTWKPMNMAYAKLVTI